VPKDQGPVGSGQVLTALGPLAPGQRVQDSAKNLVCGQQGALSAYRQACLTRNEALRSAQSDIT